MVLDITLDANVARLAHVGWELELERLALGGGIATKSPIHANCELGHWIFSSGLRKYGPYPEVWKLKEEHTKFHTIADEIIDLKLGGESKRAAAMINRLRASSRDVVYLLTALELHVARKDSEDLIDQAKGMIGRFLGGNKDTEPFPMYLDRAKVPWYAFRKKKMARLASVFDINAARLNHVIWVQNLGKAFHRNIKPKNIQHADECSLGIWINSVGRDNYLKDDEFIHLEETHRQFHDLSHKTVAELNRHDYEGADVSYQKVIQASHDIVSRLTHLEYRMQDSKTSSVRMRAFQL
ncbi:CZB domain-containing protein [Terasakiella sp. SH-1]|uniref:CZB domain-containing protein n=1 Tax=Terasakiella sp. SH-1 TaxID=2560057 RepID=UPI00107476BF|nr:CZB domain-containing protein [Terasakiella sp. SH-1]